MNTKTRSASVGGFSVLEALLVIAVLVILMALLLPGYHGGSSKERARRIQCVSNLKSIALGFRLYANDGDPYPAYEPTNSAWNYFQPLGKEIGSPKILLCPSDKLRSKAALDFETNGSIHNFSSADQQNNALSFFYGVDASEAEPNMILAGDRNISTNKSMLSGLLNIETNTPLQWTPGLHEEAGNMALADGSAQQLTTPKLREALKIGFSTNGLQRLIIP